MGARDERRLVPCTKPPDLNASTEPSITRCFRNAGSDPCTLRYPWSKFKNNNSTYIAAWQHCHEIAAKVLAPGPMPRVLQWIWNFDAYDGIRDSTNAIVSPAEDWYPGDAYVDWVGVDGYNVANTMYAHRLRLRFGLRCRFSAAIRTCQVLQLLALGRPGLCERHAAEREHRWHDAGGYSTACVARTVRRATPPA
jgi:hypothetical protein